MTEVESAPRGHPGPLQSEGQQEQADNELDWVLSKDDTDNTETTQPNSIPPRSHTPSRLQSQHADRKVYDTPFPRSPSPRLSPRETDQDSERYGGSEPHSVTDDSGDEGEYDGEMTADQRMAMKELHEMKLDLAYAEEEPPEYDVKERVRQLNEELAKVPSPTEHERAIKFNENPVSLVVPPPEYPSDDEEAKGQTKGQSQGQSKEKSQAAEMDESIDSDRGESREVESVEKHDAEELVAEEVESDHEDNDTRKSKSEEVAEGDKNSDVGSDADRDTPAAADTKNSDVGSDAGSDTSATADNKKVEGGSTKKDDEKVLVERNGKFELVAVNTLSAEERQMYLPDYNKDKDTQSNSSKSSNGSDAKSAPEPHPPRHPRPATAITSSRNSGKSAPPRRVQSAKTRQIEYTTYEDYGYKSPYALTPEEKKQLQRQQSRKEEQKKKKEESEKDKKQREQEEAEDAFQAWLKQKRRDASLRRKEENERRKQEREEKGNTDDNASLSENSKRDSESAYSDWLGAKKEEKRRSRSVERAIRREQQEQYTIRPRAECDKAFRAWLRKKNSDLRKQRADEYNRTRVMRLLARQSRKSQQLAKAMTHAQEFKYVDYYGYRF